MSIHPRNRRILIRIVSTNTSLILDRAGLTKGDTVKFYVESTGDHPNPPATVGQHVLLHPSAQQNHVSVSTDPNLILIDEGLILAVTNETMPVLAP